MSTLPAWRPVTYGLWDDVSDMPPYIQRRGWSSKTGERVDLLRQRQLESLASLDRQLGRLLEVLPQNTLVIFLSNNGYLCAPPPPGYSWRATA
jgi:arylsulfatase A-like enzyme